jgi:NAD(P)H-flavin reductase
MSMLAAKGTLPLELLGLCALCATAVANPPFNFITIAIAALLLFWRMFAVRSPPTFLTGERQTVRLRERENLTHDTVRFRFSLPEGTALGLPVGKALKVFVPNLAARRAAVTWNPRPADEARGRPAAPRCRGSGEGDVDAGGAWKSEIVRKYTPCTLDSDLGFFDIIVKVYRGGVNPIFPDGGKASQYLDTLAPGDALDVQGPFGHVEYLGRSVWKGRLGRSGKKGRLGLLAGGSGVTPMLQLVQAILRDPEDSTRVSLIYANRTEADIIVRDTLDRWAAESAGQFRVHYTLDEPPPGWKGSTGFVTQGMIAEHLPAPTPETLMLACGPPPMVRFACRANLEALGYDMKGGFASF